MQKYNKKVKNEERKGKNFLGGSKFLRPFGSK